MTELRMDKEAVLRCDLKDADGNVTTAFKSLKWTVDRSGTLNPVEVDGFDQAHVTGKKPGIGRVSVIGYNLEGVPLVDDYDFNVVAGRATRISIGKPANYTENADGQIEIPQDHNAFTLTLSGVYVAPNGEEYAADLINTITWSSDDEDILVVDHGNYAQFPLNTPTAERTVSIKIVGSGVAHINVQTNNALHLDSFADTDELTAFLTFKILPSEDKDAQTAEIVFLGISTPVRDGI